MRSKEPKLPTWWDRFTEWGDAYLPGIVMWVLVVLIFFGLAFSRALLPPKLIQKWHL